MSEPFFPPPKKESASLPEPGYRAPAARASGDDAPAKKAVVVQRAEAPPESTAPAPKGARPKLSKEEVQALLATSGALEEKPSTALVLGKRSWILVPVGLVSKLFGLLFGDHAFAVDAVVTGIGLVLGALYILAPLRKQKREGWH